MGAAIAPSSWPFYSEIENDPEAQAATAHRPPALEETFSPAPRLNYVLWIGALLFLLSLPAFALQDERYVEFTSSTAAFAVVDNETATPLHLDGGSDLGVRRAAHDLQADIERVTGMKPTLTMSEPPAGRRWILIGTLGRSPTIDRLVSEGKIDVSTIQGRWESSVTQVVDQPLPGVDRTLIIAGSDKRGTIYGLYDLSEQMGVSPWYWWADVPVARHPSIFVHPGRHLRAEPAVKYRGIFLNDEAPALSGWVHEKFGNYNHEFYTRVFELLLRLKANYLWPAMWNNAFNEDDPLNPQLADEFGIVMGTSHHEPMLRAQQEWKRHGRGPWDYARNDAVLREFWSEGVRRNRSFESIVTLGMRGDGDVPMSEESNVALLERIVADQRKILSTELKKDPPEIPQLWALYKEVQDYYEKGMRVPDDVTLLWCDDNWGNIRRLPTMAERKRPGGAGVYYHLDYVGGPRSYKWINTVPIAKVSEQMNLAWQYGANRIWIVNVGDLKPLEFPLEFFLTLAWAPEKWSANRLGDYTRLWAVREFGSEHAEAIAELVSGYTKFNGRRKPELLEPTTYSLVNYHEAERVVATSREWVERAEAIQAKLPAAARDAFFQLVLHPVKASALVNELYVEAGLNRLYATQGRASTNTKASRVRALFQADEALTRQYNEDLGGGRWRHFMDQTHLGYTYWQQPARNAMPAVTELQVPAAAEMGLAVEGSTLAWPSDDPGQGGARLPVIDSLARPVRTLEVFNRGREPFQFAVETTQPWLTVTPSEGRVEADTRLTVAVDWSRVPAGQREGLITVHGASRDLAVVVPLDIPQLPGPAEFAGFVETEHVVSIEAEHYSRALSEQGITWQILPDHGRTLSAVTTYPVTAASEPLSSASPRLEYNLFLPSAGKAEVNLFFSPSLAFQPGRGLRCAVSFDDDTPELIDIAPSKSSEWEQAVKDSVRQVTSHSRPLKPGKHVLKFWRVDPGVVLQKIVIDLGGVRPSYLGPPESFRIPEPTPRG